MKKNFVILCLVFITSLMVLVQCKQSEDNTPPPKEQWGGYETQEQWGNHLVTIAACNDCHTPKKMTAQGPDLDSSLLLSGHPAKLPPPDVDRNAMEAKGFVVTQDLTAWVGPWGISYTANLTPDSTGIGSWKEDQFLYAIRHGKLKGMASSRSLLPPMPWQMYKSMSDNELKAVFAYLKSIRPVSNVVPPPVPPQAAHP